MVKLIFLCRRRPDIDHQRYADLLLNGHVPIALRHHPTMRKYVVNIVEQSPPDALELDSVGELSFATLEDFERRLYDSPDGERIVRRDVAGFMGEAHAYATTEHVQKDVTAPDPLGTRSAGLKLICPIRRLPALTHEQFVEHWLERHVPLAREHHPGLTKYVTNVVDRRLSDGGEQWDGFAELHFAGERDATEGLFPTPEAERIIREDIARFIARALPYRVAEYVEKM
jgi:uncharacterized protein (TIGR02118 family)